MIRKFKRKERVQSVLGEAEDILQCACDLAVNFTQDAAKDICRRPFTETYPAEFYTQRILKKKIELWHTILSPT